VRPCCGSPMNRSWPSLAYFAALEQTTRPTPDIAAPVEETC
jgi:hypothetical protein